MQAEIDLMAFLRDGFAIVPNSSFGMKVSKKLTMENMRKLYSYSVSMSQYTIFFVNSVLCNSSKNTKAPRSLTLRRKSRQG